VGGSMAKGDLLRDQELTRENVADYLRERGWVGPEDVRALELSGGVSNVVLRVEAGGRLLVVKQSRPKLRTKEDWFGDLDRVFREQEVMEVLHPLLPAGVVPRVLHSDRERYVFAMEHAPEPSRVWKELLLRGQADDSIALQAGRILGRIHEETGRCPE